MHAKPVYHLGLDIGSTTAKIVVLNPKFEILEKRYVRHNANIQQIVHSLLEGIEPATHGGLCTLAVTGSGGMNVAEALESRFVQEVIASTRTIEHFLPETDVVIELGGEDAKITYLGHSLEQRMNGTCAGGTGAFLDQMAGLLGTDTAGLDVLAASYHTLHPIASRCGVFAKTDVQPLVNEGAPREDIAASILQAVVVQTVSALAQGRPIRGRVAFLGGPLAFLPQLRRRFIETLGLKEGEARLPPDAEYAVAVGAAMTAAGLDAPRDAAALFALSPRLFSGADGADQRAEPLFRGEEEYAAFAARHAAHSVERAGIGSHSGPAYLGIDAGSTTTKLALIDADGRLLASSYGPNQGDPLLSVREQLAELYASLPRGAFIGRAVVTGYGERLIQTALRADGGEVETIAHYRAAERFYPGVGFVLDIGGQDMKCLSIHDGVIDSILLNEACSSGCGSFIETYARSLGLETPAFVRAALFAPSPVDLGSRCTVFMNSRVKQAQKLGAGVGDIAAGVCLSVVRNALFKVIRMRDPARELPARVVVQGGTLLNDAVLRSLERILGREVVRPDIAGIMGAYGAALIAKDAAVSASVGALHSTLLGPEELQAFAYTTTRRRCEGCTNACLLAIMDFGGDVARRFVTGNRCERGESLALGEAKEKNELPDLYDFKYKRLFRYKPLAKADAPRGEIGLPRVLNMFEDYPFWFTFFTRLGFRVVLSRPSSRAVYELGFESIPSESVCYPAKLVHGHVLDLVRRGVKLIFHPSIPKSKVEDADAQNSFNCPVVASYPETIAACVEEVMGGGVRYLHPFLPLDHPARLEKRLAEEFAAFGIGTAELREALGAAWAERETYRKEVEAEGRRALAELRAKGLRGIVLAGRPYHVDPEFHHGIPALIRSLGFGVLSEDAVAGCATIERPLRVVDQWTYHTRLYAAATFVAANDDLELVQLNSFGCGLDAVTTDQVREILHRHGKIHTLLKIDEISGLGAVRVRLRSLAAALDERRKRGARPHAEDVPAARVVFTKAMKKTHTLLIPQMSPIHWQFFKPGFEASGLKVEVLPPIDHEAVDEGLRSVNNDACYPSILVTGQIMHALRSGRFEADRTAVLISQTGGGCRATNYIAFIRKALADAGLAQVPVVSVNAKGMEPNPGFRFSLPMAARLVKAVLYGDLLMRVLYRTRPYERVKGSADALHELWAERINRSLHKKVGSDFARFCRRIVRDFDELPRVERRIPRVGIVGEILVKFHPTANNNIVELIESEGAEAVMPDLADFLLYCAHNQAIKHELLSGTWLVDFAGRAAIALIERYRKPMADALRRSRHFTAPARIEELGHKASRVLSLGNQTGEGWFLTAEMIELIESGVPNIACVQPFACLPNHITGKGMIKALRRLYPDSNIAAIDYDPGASEVNQLNRLKLMLAIAARNLEGKASGAEEKTPVTAMV